MFIFDLDLDDCMVYFFNCRLIYLFYDCMIVFDMIDGVEVIVCLF